MAVPLLVLAAVPILVVDSSALSNLSNNDDLERNGDIEQRKDRTAEEGALCNCVPPRICSVNCEELMVVIWCM